MPPSASCRFVSACLLTDIHRSYVYSIRPLTQRAWTTCAHLTFPQIYYGTDVAMTHDYVHFSLGGACVFSWQFRENKVLKWRTPGQGFAHRVRRRDDSHLLLHSLGPL
jgi:hypothetical protein